MTPMKKDLALPLDVFIGNANGKGLIRIETSIDARPSGVHITSLTRDKKEYAELIVRAVNNFDALLFYSKDILEQIKQFKDKVAINTSYLETAIKNAEK